MKFTLTFDGELPSTGNGSRKTEKKWEIRKHFAPQLEELWQTHAALRQVKDGFIVWPRPSQYIMSESHHEYDESIIPSAPVTAQRLQAGQIDLCALIEKNGRSFKPIVRKSFALTCSLDVLFMRKESPGKLYQGGDLDNRIKTLLDSFSIPRHKEQMIEDPTIADPIYCLIEDDSLITGIAVRTERLLSRQIPESTVRLVIDVDVRVSNSRFYNAMFLGD
jgi:hypothetical protein